MKYNRFSLIWDIFRYLLVVGLVIQGSVQGVNEDVCPSCSIVQFPLTVPQVPGTIMGTPVVTRTGTHFKVRFDAPSPPVGLFVCEEGDSPERFDGSVSPGFIEVPYYVPKGKTRSYSVKFNNKCANPCVEDAFFDLPSTQGWVTLYGGPGTVPPEDEDEDGDPIDGPYGEKEEEPGEGCGSSFTPEECGPINEDTRVKPDLAVPAQVEIVSEVIPNDRVKHGYNPYLDQPDGEIPDYYLQEEINTSLLGGNPESTVGGTLVRRICKYSGREITVQRTGNPSFYGIVDSPSAILTETTYTNSWDVGSYDDCPNAEADEPATMTVSTVLSDLYDTPTFIADTFSSAWGFKGYFEQVPARAELSISETEDSMQFTKVKYKIRVPASATKPYKAVWVEEFTPKDEDPEDEVDPEKVYTLKSESITGKESAEYIIDPSDDPGKEGSWKVMLLPLEVDRLSSIQIPWAPDANYLPNRTGREETPYVLLGAAQSNNFDNAAHLRLKLKSPVPVEMRNKLLWGFEVGNYPDGSGMHTCYDLQWNAASDEFDFKIFPSNYRMKLVAGWDVDGDGSLSWGEKMEIPKYKWVKNYVTTDSDWEVIAISKNQYQSAIEWLELYIGGWDLAQMTQGAELLTAFLFKDIPDEASISPVKIARNEMSHSVGVIFEAPDLPGDSVTISYPGNGEMAKAVAESAEFSAFIGRQLHAKRQEVIDRFAANPGSLEEEFEWVMEGGSISYKPVEANLWVALGRVEIVNLSVKLIVHRSEYTVTSLHATSKLTDVYDFNYEDAITIWAAQVQSGYNTLGESGRVTKTEVDIDNRLVPRLGGPDSAYKFQN